MHRAVGKLRPELVVRIHSVPQVRCRPKGPQVWVVHFGAMNTPDRFGPPDVFIGLAEMIAREPNGVFGLCFCRCQVLGRFRRVEFVSIADQHPATVFLGCVLQGIIAGGDFTKTPIFRLLVKTRAEILLQESCLVVLQPIR